MLTINARDLPLGKPHRCWLIEVDWEYGTVQHLGEGTITPDKDGRGNFGVESHTTGGCYLEATMIADVELWIAEEHYLAAFATEDAMHHGGHALATAFGARMPVGIYAALF